MHYTHAAMSLTVTERSIVNVNVNGKDVPNALLPCEQKYF